MWNPFKKRNRFVELGNHEQLKEAMEELPEEKRKMLKQELTKQLKEANLLDEEQLTKEMSQEDLKDKGIIIELDAIPEFIDFVGKNLKKAGYLVGQDLDGQKGKHLKEFLKYQEKLFKESISRGGNKDE